MNAWLVAAPLLLAGYAATHLAVRRRGKAALGVLVAVDAVVLVAALLVLVVAVTGSALLF